MMIIIPIPMARYEFISEFRTHLHGKRSLLKALAVCAVLGGVYGATLGSAIGAVPGAVGIIEIAAGIMAVLCDVPGARIGLFIGVVTQNRFGRLFLGLFAAIGGAIVGGFLATVLLLAFGAVLGAVCGSVLATGIIALRRDVVRRFLVGVGGGVLGGFVGANVWAINLNEKAALAGSASGLGIGAVVGPLLLLAAIGALNSIAKTHVSGRRTYIDATFQREDHDEHPTSLPRNE